MRGMDTMDVWFDSGVAWRAALQPRGIHVNPSSTSSSSPAAPASSSTSTVSSIQVPAVDVVLEGEDQYRGWFQSLLLTSGLISILDAFSDFRCITHPKHD